MFDRISGAYDAMNTVISCFQEPRWRNALVRSLRIDERSAVLDVACGTGAVCATVARRVGRQGRVVGIDFSPRMLARARKRRRRFPQIEFREGDALDLPVGDAEFDAATIAFGMRNLPDYRSGFREMARAVRPGGIVACLEISRPHGRAAALVRLWFDRIVPLIGRLVGMGGDYTYLVESTKGYPAPDRVAAIMRDAGLVDVTWRPMTFGVVTLHVGRVPRR